MKKIALFTAFVAALFLVSCIKENQNAPVTLERVAFQTQETKAVFDTPSGTSYPTLWTANDTKVAISYNYTGGSSPVSVDLTPASGGQSATFTADFPVGLDSYEFIAVSPAAVVKSWNATNKTANVEIVAGQTSTAGSPDESAMILYSTAGPYTSLPKNVDMTFHHFTGYLHLVFTNYESALSAAGATVQSVSVTSAKDIAGRFFFKPADGSVTVNSGAKTISVATASLADVWVALVPVDLSGETLTFVVATDKGTMTQEVALPASRNLASGAIAKITVDMTGKTVTPPVQYNLVTDAAQLNVGDKIIIVVANDDKALSTTQNSNNRASTSVIKGAGVIMDPSAAVEVITLEDGDVPGEFAFKTSSGGYLYAAGGSSSNWLRTAAASEVTPATAPLGSFDIQIKNGQANGTGDNLHEPAEGTTDNVAWIQAKAVPRGIMFYNGIKHATNRLFSCYSGTYYYTSFLQIYRLDEPAVDHFKAAMPRANTEGNVTVAAAGEALTVKVFSSVAWTASGTAAALLDKTSGTGNDVLTLTVPENTGTTELAYQLVISTAASVSPNSYTFNLSQLAPVSGGAAVGDILWAENWVGGVANQTPASYYSSGNATTTVYGSATVTYSIGSGDSTTKLYADGLVYLVNNKGTESPATYLAPEQINNLLLKKSGGVYGIAGIPCPGVKTAVLTYKSNTYPSTTRNITVTTDTEKVTASALTYVSKSNTYTYSDSSEQTKTYYEITCTVSFDATFSGTTFNLQFNNGYSSNIRITDMKLEVTEVW